MGTTTAGFFKTRRDAEWAVERLVQEHKIARTDIFIEPEGDANTAGTVASGADAESGHPGVEKEGAPKLAGRIKVSVDLNSGGADVVRAAFAEFGGQDISSG